MAENKKSFVLYADYIGLVSKLPDEIAGKLLKIILDYVNDKNPVIEDILLQVAFEPIKMQLKRDLHVWELSKEKRSEAGKKGMGVRWHKKPITEITPDNNVINDITEITVNVTDTVNGNVTVSDNTHPLENSNLFRKPNIPTLETVLMKFSSSGGTKEMAEKFYSNYESVGWYLKGSPITNFANLVPSFISAWNKNNEGKPKNNTDVKNTVIKL